MEKTLFGFIWKYSKRQQFILLLVTVTSFPLLYASLELPKIIINDAIGAQTSNVSYFGIAFTQIEFLLILCFAFLATVFANGIVKMRLNTMKGVLAERMLRRFRFQLITRMMRFPQPYFRTTSQGELVAMVTSEAEPMGGLMGDAVAQPVFQAGYMLTILVFLFAQSVWFGLASIALIPLQAWLIPMLQRQINLLNKDRIQEVRHLASEIGETAAGIGDLRTNGGVRYRLAQFTSRLGRLFEIRFRIYQKKFFMKFLNNFITQLTPFFFYAVGGYLTIVGEITVGALVAALGAYKDIASPWKELLFYYNQVQDMSLRWEIVTERFAPRDMVPEDLFLGEPNDIPHLKGEIVFEKVRVEDQDGNKILEDFDLTIPPGACVAIQSSNPMERRAVAELLTRETLAKSGEVTVAGRDIQTLHQAVIAARIGHAHSRPYLFDGTLRENLLMPLRVRPSEAGNPDRTRQQARMEAERTGNSLDPLDADWFDPDLAGLMDGEDVREWWFQLVKAMGVDEAIYRRALRSRIDPLVHGRLTRDIVALRRDVAERLTARGLDEAVHHFDEDSFNPTIPLGGNLLFAAPIREISQERLASASGFMGMLRAQGLADDALGIAIAVMTTLQQTFGLDGTDHPLFRRLGMDEEMYRRLTEIAAKGMRSDREALSEEECALMLTVPFLLTAEQIGPSFPEETKSKIVRLRKTRATDMRKFAEEMFVPISDDAYIPLLTVVENAIYGRVSLMAGAQAEEVENLVADVMEAHGLRQRLASLLFDLYDIDTGLGGAKLPTIIQERAAFSRAGIKRPDILVLDKALASHDAKNRAVTRRRLQELLPGTTMIFMEDHFENPQLYDLFVDIKDGRLDGSGVQDLGDGDASDDLRRKLRIIAETELFERLDAKNQRLLAFSAQWYEAKAGQTIFLYDQIADAAYLCLSGGGELRLPEHKEGDQPITEVEPGRLIGDLSIILRERRLISFVTTEDSKFLRIGAKEFRDVIESDVSVAVSLLETVAGHLTGLVEFLRASQINLADLGRQNSAAEASIETAAAHRLDAPVHEGLDG
ncbi:MAG: cyclic nucleotide-binding domain-containing protein [Rhodobacteraceae bacterium]|nr:cyclic nucleotide-binding domain-containing protein [Paracoccaceae bacterium]